MTLAGGGLAVSVTFLEKLAGSTRSYVGVLVSGWVLLVASVALVLISIHCSNESMLEAHGRYRWRDDSGEQGGWFAKGVKHLNWVALGTTVLGLLLVAIFSALNLKGR